MGIMKEGWKWDIRNPARVIRLIDQLTLLLFLSLPSGLLLHV